jgi:hypothetical protein
LDFRKEVISMKTRRVKKASVSCSNYKRLPLILSLYIALCLLSMPSLTWAGYSYTELLLPPGCTSGNLSGINDKGDLVGHGYDGTATKGFLYSKGIYTELLPTGWSWSEAWAINEVGAVVGYGYDGTATKGFLYSKGIYTELLPTGWSWAQTFGINAKGVVVGWGDDGTALKGFLGAGGR